jgi:hypothetical protein
VGRVGLEAMEEKEDYPEKEGKVSIQNLKISVQERVEGLARKEKVDNQDKMEGMAETEYSFSISPI